MRKRHEKLFIVTGEIMTIPPGIFEIKVREGSYIYFKMEGVNALNLFAFIVEDELFALYDANIKKLYATKNIPMDELRKCCVEILCYLLGTEEYENDEVEEVFEKAFEADLIPSHYIPTGAQ